MEPEKVVENIIRPGDPTTGVDYGTYLQGTEAYRKQKSEEQQAQLLRAQQTASRVRRPQGMSVPVQSALRRMQRQYGKESESLYNLQTEGLKKIDVEEYQRAQAERPIFQTGITDDPSKLMFGTYEGYSKALSDWTSKYGPILGRGEERYKETSSYIESEKGKLSAVDLAQYQEAQANKPVYVPGQTTYEDYGKALSDWTSKYGPVLGRGEERYTKSQAEIEAAKTQLEDINKAEYQKALSEAPSKLSYIYDPNKYTESMNAWITKYQNVLGRPQQYEQVKQFVEGTYTPDETAAQKAERALTRLNEFQTYKGAGGDFGQRLFSKAPQYTQMTLKGAGTINIPYFTGVYKEFIPSTGEIVTRQSNLLGFTPRGNVRIQEVELGREKLVEDNDPFVMQYLGGKVLERNMFRYTPTQSEDIAAKQRETLLMDLAKRTEESRAKTQLVGYDTASGTFFKQTRGSVNLGIPAMALGTYQPTPTKSLSYVPGGADFMRSSIDSAMSRGYNPSQIANALVGKVNKRQVEEPIPGLTISAYRPKVVTKENEPNFREYMGQQAKLNRDNFSFNRRILGKFR